MTQHASPASTGQARQDQDLLRAQHWSALGRLLAGAPDQAMLTALAGIGRDDTPMGRAWGALADKAATVTPESVQSEYFELFVGVGRGELLPYASFYLTGFLNERPLAELRRDLAVMGLEREPGRHDPEDHVASLCEIMAGLASGAFDADGLGCGGAGEAGFFARHLEPWAALFFQDLARAPSADFYRALAAVGAAWIDTETRAFALARAAAGPQRATAAVH